MKSRSPSANYNPETGSVSGVATLYEDFHENAHADQHFRQTLPWRFRQSFVTNPNLRWTGLGMLACCLCELEAVLIARREMLNCSIWNSQDRTESACGFAAYVWKMVSEF